jgi:urease accessory protein
LIKITDKILDPTGEEIIKDSICLPFDERKRGRFKTQTITGQEVGIMIDRGEVMRGGTLMRCDAGDVYKIIAADEVVTTATTDDSTLFARGCYHLGNRHVALQVGDGWLRYQNDYVLDDMLIQLGLKVIHEPAPFEPENGAYGDHGGHSHGDDDYEHPDIHAEEHSHTHDHGHSHSHSHSHSHDHSHNKKHSHEY